jgi:hypothetical protein
MEAYDDTEILRDCFNYEKDWLPVLMSWNYTFSFLIVLFYLVVSRGFYLWIY